MEERSTSFWLRALRARRARIDAGGTEPLVGTLEWQNPELRRAASKFFNAAFRAEQSGLKKAHELADLVRAEDPELAEVLVLYGDEEGWHEELLTHFLPHIGADIEPMGRITSLFYKAYGKATRIDTIVLTNLLFETLGATTYRMTLPKMEEPAIRKMLSILSRDESFHVPLNIHLLEKMSSKHPLARLRLKVQCAFLVSTMVLLPWASRPKTGAFDGLGALELSRAYAENMDRALRRAKGLGLGVPWVVRRALGVSRRRTVLRNSRRRPGKPLLRAA